MNLLEITKKSKFDWLAVAFAVAGILLNSQKMILCWPAWMLSNLFFGFYFWPRKEKAMLILAVIYFCLNIFAWTQWAIK